MDHSSMQQHPSLQGAVSLREPPSESSSDGRKEELCFDDLPISLLCEIFSKTCPQDVARLALVSKRCEEATRSDQVWNAFLPVNARDVARIAHGGPLAYQSAKGLYHQLTNHVLLEDGTQGFLLDRKTGGICWSVSATALGISWGEDPDYWTYVPEVGSRFSMVAKLNFVWWLDVWGEINVQLPCGEYTISWVLQMYDEEVESNRYESNEDIDSDEDVDTDEALAWGRNSKGFEVTCSFSENMAPEKTMQIKLSPSLRGWVSYNFGHFTVTPDLGNRERPEEVNLKFRFHNRDTGSVKSGLWVDGIIIRSGKYDL